MDKFPDHMNMDKMDLDRPSDSSLEYDIGEMSVKERLLNPPSARNLDVGIALSTGWRLFTAHPWAYLAWSLTILLVPYVAAAIAGVVWEDAAHAAFVLCRLATGHLMIGPFITASNCIRHGGPGFRVSDLFRTGIFYIFPVYLIYLVTLVFVSVGLLLFILPGWYLAVNLSFWAYVYIEYHHEIGVFDSLEISFKGASSVFCDMLLLVLALTGVLLLGVVCFGVGIFVAVPVISLTWAAAFHQVFGMNDKFDGCPERVVCCC